MAGMALDDFLMPFAAMALTHQLMDAKKRKDQQQKLAKMGEKMPQFVNQYGGSYDPLAADINQQMIRNVAPRNQGISYNPLLMR